MTQMLCDTLDSVFTSDVE